MSEGRLAGKTALVAGGGRGIGRAIALALAESGADVVPTSRSQDQVSDVAREIEAAGRRSLRATCDVSDSDRVTALVEEIYERFERIDVLVNAAAINPIWKRMEEVTLEEWDQILGVNLRAAFVLSQTVGRAMIRQGGGSIVHVSSVAGLKGTSHMGPYSVSKAGLIGLVRVLATEWARHGVRVNALAPGWVRTELTRGVLSHPQISESIVGDIPLGRVAEPEEIAPLAVYLASDEASFATGGVYTVDGGEIA